jgi:prophage antirepressor-like protein
MNSIKIFENAEFGSIRTTTVNGEVMFVGKDITDILGYANSSKALSDHVDEEDKLNNDSLSSLGQRGGWLINESGLYSLILSSKMPNAKKFKHWVTSEVLPSIRRTGSYQAPQSNTDKSKSLEVKEMNARVRMSNQYLKLASVNTLSEQYKNILVAKSAEVLAGKPLLPLPKSEQKMYSATEIGEMFNVSAQKVGRIANAYELKTDEYGEFYRDKSPYSSKEVDAFRYNDKAVERFRKLLL